VRKKMSDLTDILNPIWSGQIFQYLSGQIRIRSRYLGNLMLFFYNYSFFFYFYFLILHNQDKIEIWHQIIQTSESDPKENEKSGQIRSDSRYLSDQTSFFAYFLFWLFLGKLLSRCNNLDSNSNPFFSWMYKYSE